MFILYALPLGILAGYALGGRLDRLAGLHLRWGWLAVLGLLVQVLLFSPASDRFVAAAGPLIYVVSTGLVLLAVLRDWRIPGLAIVALGAASNLVAIVANGGVMPASPGAVTALPAGPGAGFSNSVVMAEPAMRPLTDVFALPAWLPMANVFSVGDVLIGLGVVAVLALGMRRGRPVGTTPQD